MHFHFHPSLPALSSAFLFLLLIPRALTASTRTIPLHDSPAITSLQQILALYPFAIDSKTFSNLAQVFTKNVIANYSAPIGVLDGLEAVEETLEASLSPVTTQHLLGTFGVLELDEVRETAKSITYYTASHFGTGNFTGQVVYAYGQYVDDWVVENGAWKIGRRQLNYMGPLEGNLSVFS